MIDIVERLRDCTCVPHGEICRAAADKIERLRTERDEARRIACKMEERLGCDESGYPKCGTAREKARELGWDCFDKEEPGV